MGQLIKFETHGCRSNQADTEELLSAVLEQGIEPEREVFVLNTCSVTNEADDEALKTLRKVRSENPETRLVVTGCFAEVGAGRILDEFPDASVVGTGRKGAVLEAIRSDKPLELHSENSTKSQRRERYSESLGMPVSAYTPAPGEEIAGFHAKSRFHLRIQEGCSEFCSYCIIPQTRGQIRSKSPEQIHADIKTLVEKGYNEIVLTGTHLGGYGEDIGSSLEELLLSINSEARIRLTSIDPNDVTPQIARLLTTSEQFCNHVHICIQQTSDRLLKLMNRRYGYEDLLRLTNELKSANPDFCIGSDIITGFPGETDAEFKDCLEKVSGLPVDYLHVFPYSERENTAATRLDGALPVQVKKQRSRLLRGVGKQKKLEFLGSLVGKELDVVLERGARGTSSEFAKIFLDNTSSSLSHNLGSRLRAEAVEVLEDYEAIVCRL